MASTRSSPSSAQPPRNPARALALVLLAAATLLSGWFTSLSTVRCRMRGGNCGFVRGAVGQVFGVPWACLAPPPAVPLRARDHSKGFSATARQPQRWYC
jgi:hypothetical protein